MIWRRRARDLALFILVAATSAAQERPVAIRGGQIHTMASEVIENGVVLIQKGKIVAVGRDLSIPPDARVIEAKGTIVTPGAIDSRCYVGLSGSDLWETSDPIVPQLRIIESFTRPRNHDWVREGVTSAYITAGPQCVLGGMGAVVKLAGGSPGAVKEAAGMSASVGEVPKKSFGQDAPRTRMGAFSLLRETFLDARDRTKAEAGVETRDLKQEALQKVLRKEVPLRVQANTPDDIAHVITFKKELDIEVVIDIGVGAHRVAGDLAVAKIPVVVGPNMIGAGDGGRFEFYAHTEENAAKLQKAGVKIALATDDNGGRSVVLEAAISKAHGLPEVEALEAITRNAAEILGVSDRLGTIEKGKDADIVIWDKHPLSTWGRTLFVFVDGEIVFQREGET